MAAADPAAQLHAKDSLGGAHKPPPSAIHRVATKLTQKQRLHLAKVYKIFPMWNISREIREKSTKLQNLANTMHFPHIIAETFFSVLICFMWYDTSERVLFPDVSRKNLTFYEALN
jgi:hypothetical protein